MHKNFAKRTLGRRIVALVAAYAIALSGLAASFGAARAAAMATEPGGVICHTLAAGQPSPASDHGGDKVCADCCIGCLLLTAALPPPPADAVAVPHTSSQPVAAPQIVGLTGSSETKDHRSRAPPLTA